MKKIKCFISYSHKDQKYLQEFQTHLEGLKRIVNVTEWYDGNISVGENIDKEIYNNMEKSDIIFLLLSPNYIQSIYCFEKELETAMERYNNGECLIIPILIKKVGNLKQYEFSKYKITPPDAKAVSTFKPISDGFAKVMEDVYNLVKTKFPANKPNYRIKDGTNRKIKSNPIMTFEIIQRNRIVNKQLNKEFYIELKNYINKQTQFERRLTSLLANSIIEFKKQHEKERNKKQFAKWHKNQFESYCVQILEYTKKIMNNNVSALHLRWLKDNYYISFVNAGYKEVSTLSTHSLPVDDPMISAAFHYSLPIIKSLNTQLHNKNHNNESNKRDYVTCAFSNIKETFKEELTLCISCDNNDAKNAQTRLLVMSFCRIDIKIESFIQTYIETCMQIDDRFSLKKIGGIILQ